MRYKVSYDLIEPDDYIQMRITCGLLEKRVMAAVIGLANSLCCISIYDTEDDNKFVGMGRLVGDGGCNCQVVDICVLPEYQGQGLGKLIMTELTTFINDNLPESCYVNLMAYGESHKLYEQFGFEYVWPGSRGMGYTKEN